MQIRPRYWGPHRLIQGLAVLLLGLAPGVFLTAGAEDAVARGKYLATAAGCAACHTDKGGAAYAGGLAMNTPFGPLVTPNITRDKQTGIGNWSDDDFYRAMHDGIGKHEEYLYPAMPFAWYTKISREDDLAIKAYLFSLPPVRKARAPSGLRFPYNVRDGLVAWREVFFQPGEFKPDVSHSEQINRGDYLVNGPGHCGACHNGRLLAGQSKYQKPLQGGAIDDWYAPNITSDVHDGIGAWSEAELVQYFKTGSVPGKGIAVGPMAETVQGLAKLSDEDLHAIAMYIKSTPPSPDEAHEDPGATAVGASVYLDNCAFCHGVNGQGLAKAVPSLAGNGAVIAEGPQNVLQVIVGGLQASQSYAPMLAIGAGMSDRDVAEVANYVRQSWGNKAPATATPDMVAAVRSKADTPMNAGPIGGCTDIGPPALAKAIEDPKRGIGSLVQATREANMPQQVDRIVAKLKTTSTAASQAEIVNGLTARYCRVVHEDRTLDWNQKALQLGHFSELVYTRLSSNIAFVPVTR